MKAMLIGLAALAALGSAAVGWFWFSSARFEAHIDTLRTEMIGTQQARGAGPAGDLPAILRDYALRAGGTVGGPAVFHARHRATLASSRDAAPMDLVADQWTGTARPGIVWRARAAMMGVPVTVVDAYVDGVGELSVRALGTIPVAGGTGPDYDRGELLRYLSELPLYPDAILNAEGLDWRQLDAGTVEVTALSNSGPGVIRFYFDAKGDIVRMECDDRPMEVSGETVLTPWHGLYSDYRSFGAYRIPAYGEVGWVLPDGLFTYWHGTVTEYAPMDAS